MEHPALPQPFERTEQDARRVAVGSLGPEDRRRIAAQMVAVSALLGDVELWPGRRALQNVTVEKTEDGPGMRLPTLPVALSVVWTRLGGGEPAARATRRAVIDAVTEVTGVDLGTNAAAGSEPGFFLDGVLGELLNGLERPLDAATARSLWMWRWSPPRLPDPGDTLLAGTADLRLARRMGAALWAAAIRAGRGATFQVVTADGETLTVAERKAANPLRVVAGSFREDTAAALVVRSDANGAATVALGRFPAGWNTPSQEGFNPSRLEAHLGIVGVRPSQRQRVFDDLTGRFDPHSRSDRRRLTERASVLYTSGQRRRTGRFSQLRRVAGLAAEGIPVPLARELAEATDDDLADATRQHAVLIRAERLMLPVAVPVRVDPFHNEVAPLFPPDSPERMLHAALAAGNAGEVLEWARARLDDLDAVAVRELLSRIEPGALGSGVQAALAEACLSLADMEGARRALDGVDKETAGPWLSWLQLLDRQPQGEVPLPRSVEVRHAPRACAEIALVALRRSLGWSAESAGRALVVIGEAMDNLGGAARRWVEIRLAARLKPDRLNDRVWRREVADGNPALVGLLLFERSTRAILNGEFGLARRLLRIVMAAESAPGRLAPMQVNLGHVEAELGRPMVSEALMLRAYRLFQAAGFHHREWVALHNLAVADIDQLRLRRAARRLDALGRIELSILDEVERARLALACGRLEEFHCRLDELPAIEETSDRQIVEALCLLRGVEALIDGSPKTAESLLLRGGEEGRGWLELAGAAPAGEGVEDGWGVRRAAALATRLRNGDDIQEDHHSLDLKDAMAVALCRQLGLRPGWPDHDLRRLAARVLEEGGLDGWSVRTRWCRDEADGLLRGLSGVIRQHGLGSGDEEAVAELLDAVGIDGLEVRDVAGGRKLLAMGEGQACSSVLRGRIEVIPLGAEPFQGPAWELLLDLLELLQPTGAVEEIESGVDEVRLDGASPATARLRDEVRRTAGPSFTVLIHGETGTGKEVVAREIHRLSGRSGDLVGVNVAAIPATLLESELFGAVKGAFTGADRSRRGLVAAAEGGTLFLDEVGDLDVVLQVKLLRFLEGGEIRSVGSDQAREVDVRVVCATHRNLERLVREGRFREDLYFRMAVARIEVSPLRERAEDIPVLRAIFEREAAQQHGLPIPTWSRPAEEILMNHSWPGNLRELKNTVEFAMARSGGRRIRPEDLPIEGGKRPLRGTWEANLANFKRSFLTDVLARHQGNRSSAARELGISRQGLLYQIKKLGLTDL